MRDLHSRGALNKYTPADIGTLKGNDPLRQQFLELAAYLDDYNNRNLTYVTLLLETLIRCGGSVGHHRALAAALNHR